MNNNHEVTMSFLNVEIPPDVLLEMIGWDSTELELLNSNVKTDVVSKITLMSMKFSDCSRYFDENILVSNINTCARIIEKQRISPVI